MAISDPTAATESASAPAEAPLRDAVDGFRETVESVIFAFLLAFLFKLFCAEAFVIPTGSMAPTLLGRHKDLACSACGLHYQVSAAKEVDAHTGRLIAGVDVRGSTCPNCRFNTRWDENAALARHFQSYNGDRILSTKYTTELRQPRRWDVVVFRFPEEAHEHFIKRLVGLPNETLRIANGDVFTLADSGQLPTTSAAAARPNICRKSPEKVRATLQLVHDNDCRPVELLQAGWPTRWYVVPAESGANESDGTGWSSQDDGRSFTSDPQATRPRWIRYRHVVPTLRDWQHLRGGGCWDAQHMAPPRPQLISDFYAYNSYRFTTFDAGASAEVWGRHWVGDLCLECTAEVRQPVGRLHLELIEGERRFSCHLDLAAGQAELAISGEPAFEPRAEVRLAAGRHRLAFANIDDQLLLWVDERLVTFSGETTYDPLENQVPGALDLSPAGIAAEGADVHVSQLKLWRDVYYISSPEGGGSDFPLAAFQSPAQMNAEQLAEFLADPQKWQVFLDRETATFHLGADEFLMLGDNSPQSHDGRGWSAGHAVRRELLVGQALCVYWPHAWPAAVSWKVPRTDVHFPFWPNMARMKWIH